MGYPSVGFGMIQSKIDSIQIMYYDLMKITMTKNKFPIAFPKFLQLTNSVFEDYVEVPNFSLMYVNGNTHQFTEKERFYTAGTLGPDSWSPVGHPTLSQWVTDVVSGVPRPTSQCAGPVEAN